MDPTHHSLSAARGATATSPEEGSRYLSPKRVAEGPNAFARRLRHTEGKEGFPRVTVSVSLRLLVTSPQGFHLKRRQISYISSWKSHFQDHRSPPNLAF